MDIHNELQTVLEIHHKNNHSSIIFYGVLFIPLIVDGYS